MKGGVYLKPQFGPKKPYIFPAAFGGRGITVEILGYLEVISTKYKSAAGENFELLGSL